MVPHNPTLQGGEQAAFKSLVPIASSTQSLERSFASNLSIKRPKSHDYPFQSMTYSHFGMA